MKKLAAFFLAFTLVFSSVGTTLFFSDSQSVEAKSYKSGKKGFNSNIQNNQTNTNKSDATNNNNVTNKNQQDKTKKDEATETKKGGFLSGGLMKGLMIGGLAGLLFGGLFGDMGALGSILGFAINALAIVAIIALCVKLFRVLTRKKDEDKKSWNN